MTYKQEFKCIVVDVDNIHVTMDVIIDICGDDVIRSKNRKFDVHLFDHIDNLMGKSIDVVTKVTDNVLDVYIDESKENYTNLFK